MASAEHAKTPEVTATAAADTHLRTRRFSTWARIGLGLTAAAGIAALAVMPWKAWIVPAVWAKVKAGLASTAIVGGGIAAASPLALI